jgi:hypothetical protein
VWLSVTHERSGQIPAFDGAACVTGARDKTPAVSRAPVMNLNCCLLSFCWVIRERPEGPSLDKT